jgi:hypothetical protein
MVNTSLFHQTVIEKVMGMFSPSSSAADYNNKDSQPEKSDLFDIRIQIFMVLYENPDKKFTIGDLAEEINKRGMLCIIPSRKEKLGLLLNIMYVYDLVVYDFPTRTYAYKYSETSNILKNNIELLKAL